MDLEEDRKERTPDTLGKGVGKEIRGVSQSSDARCPSIISSNRKGKNETVRRGETESLAVQPMFTEDRRRRVATRKIRSSFWSLYPESVVRQFQRITVNASSTELDWWSHRWPSLARLKVLSLRSRSPVLSSSCRLRSSRLRVRSCSRYWHPDLEQPRAELVAESAYASKMFAFPLESLARAAVTFFAFGRRHQASANRDAALIISRDNRCGTFRINIKSLCMMINLQNIQ